MRVRAREEEDFWAVTVTEHALERYRQRARRTGTARRLASEITAAIRSAVDLELVLSTSGGAHVAPLVARGVAMCAVLDVRGPSMKPFAVTVCTILTMEMAIKTFGHVPGLITTMRAAGMPLAA